MRATAKPRRDEFAPERLDPFFVLFAVGFLLRCFVAGDILDRFYPYNLPGGSPLLKIHPGSYVIFATAAWSFLRPANPVNSGIVLPAALLATITVVGVAWTAVTDNTTAIGALFDLYLVAAAALFTVSRFSEGQRKRLFAVILAMLAVNGVLLLAEFALQHRLVSLAAATTGGVFRPAGLLGHPLVDGLCYATLAPLMLRIKAPLFVRLAVSGAAVALVLVSGARFASIVAAAMLPITALVALRGEPGRAGPRRWGVWLQAVLMAMALPLSAAAAMAGGLGYRFSNSLIDQSSLKRINDFQLLNYIGPHEWWFGGSIGALQSWSQLLFNGDSIESPIVIGVFLYGLPLTVVLLALAFTALGTLALRSGAVERLSLAAFLITVCSGNGLMVKGPALLYVVVLVASLGAGTLKRTARLRQGRRALRTAPVSPRRRSTGSPAPVRPARSWGD